MAARGCTIFRSDANQLWTPLFGFIRAYNRLLEVFKPKPERSDNVIWQLASGICLEPKAEDPNEAFV